MAPLELLLAKTGSEAISPYFDTANIVETVGKGFIGEVTTTWTGSFDHDAVAGKDAIIFETQGVDYHAPMLKALHNNFPNIPILVLDATDGRSRTITTPAAVADLLAHRNGPIVSDIFFVDDLPEAGIAASYLGAWIQSLAANKDLASIENA